jgi:hypothetical protein
LVEQINGYAYGGILSSTEWVPFDLQRDDLLHCLEAYVEEERRGGIAYQFQHPETVEESMMTAQDALACYKQTGKSPLSKWQTHVFTFEES